MTVWLILLLFFFCCVSETKNSTGSCAFRRSSLRVFVVTNGESRRYFGEIVFRFFEKTFKKKKNTGKLHINDNKNRAISFKSMIVLFLRQFRHQWFMIRVVASNIILGGKNFYRFSRYYIAIINFEVFNS